MSEKLLRKEGMTGMMHRVEFQTENKKLWLDNDGPEEVVKMMEAELEELKQAVQESMLSGDVFNVASEIGDVLYLALKFCSLTGLVPEDVVELKILRNDMKYPNDLNSFGNYAERHKQSKEFWKAMGGDSAFSHAYLEMFSDMEEEAPKTPTELFADAMARNDGGQ